MEEAAERRALQELGVPIRDLTWLFKFQYQARFRDVGSEFELCHVLFARAAGPILANPSEIAAWQWIAVDELDRQLREAPNRFTPWLRIEWQRINEEFTAQLNVFETPVETGATRQSPFN